MILCLAGEAEKNSRSQEREDLGYGGQEIFKERPRESLNLWQLPKDLSDAWQRGMSEFDSVQRIAFTSNCCRQRTDHVHCTLGLPFNGNHRGFAETFGNSIFGGGMFLTTDGPSMSYSLEQSPWLAAAIEASCVVRTCGLDFHAEPHDCTAMDRNGKGKRHLSPDVTTLIRSLVLTAGSYLN